ncbi:TPA: hypothetical protein ACKP2K_001535 [Serratia marcescens]
MDNKLSELSKPVAWAHRPEINAPIDVTENEYVARNWLDVHERNVQPLYSQEYVSALDKVAQFWIGESAGWKKRAEDAEKRIAELNGLFETYRAQNDMWCKLAGTRLQRATELEKERDYLKTKLARPVKLPKTNGYWDEQEKAFEDAITLAKRAVRLAGFTVEGDE